MRDVTVARSYAEALFEVGDKHQAHERISAALNAMSSLLNATPMLRAFLESPKIEPAAKKDTLRKALANRAEPLFINFLMVLINKRRQRLLGAIANEYRGLVDERMGRLHVEVTLARMPDDKTSAEMTDRLSKSLGKQVIPHVNINREILGGVIVRYGDRVLDGSLRRRLVSLRRRMLDSTLPSI